MKILTRYVLSELLQVFLVTLTALTLFMLIVGLVKEAQQQGLGLLQILMLVPYVLPEAMRFAVPGTMLFAFLGFLSPAGPAQRMLAVGAKLGGGPYRSHDCTATADLLEGIVASIETAAEGLDGSPRARAEESARKARALAGSGDHRGAIGAAAAAIGVYAGAVEAARADANGRQGRAPA